jgi:hypothetical protein
LKANYLIDRNMKRIFGSWLLAAITCMLTVIGCQEKEPDLGKIEQPKGFS